MGDDIGWMQSSIYHEACGLARRPTSTASGSEGAIFMDYVAMQSCTSGRNAFFTGMYPLRTGMIPPQLPGSPSYLRPGTPALAKFLHDLGYTTGEFGKNHLGDHTACAADGARLPGVLGLPLPSRRDAGSELPRPQQDSADAEASRRRARTRRSPALPEVPGAVDPRDHDLPDAAAPGHLVSLIGRDGREPDLQG